jgi:hypothetical protein
MIDGTSRWHVAGGKERAMQAVSRLDTATVAGLLRAQAAALRAEVEALAAELSRWRPGPDEWCVSETVGHLIEAERRGFNGRIRTILAQDNPRLPDWDQVQVARERNDAARDGADVLREFAELRADSIALVEGLRPEQLGRRGEHKLVGSISVEDLLHEWVHHDRNHVSQVFSVLQAYVWPNMGNCRRFSEPH